MAFELATDDVAPLLVAPVVAEQLLGEVPHDLDWLVQAEADGALQLDVPETV